MAIAVGIAVWIAMNTYWTDVTVRGDMEGEADHNPYYSVQHLANALGIRTQLIASLSSPLARDDVLLINGIQDDLLHSRTESLAPWVESGGRLIVTGDAVWANPALQSWSGIAPGSRLVEEKTSSALSTRPEVDADCAPLTVKAGGVPSGEIMTFCAPPSPFEFVSKRLSAWSLSSEYGAQILRVNIGRGSVTVIPRVWLIENKTLLRHDHAQIFITASQLGRGDKLYILNVSRAETLIAMLWRLAAPAIVFFGIAILCTIARHLPRFGPPAPTPAAARRSLAEQIRANAAFAWRTRHLGSLRTAVGRALDDTARRRIASYGALPQLQRASALARLTGVDLKSLNAAMTEDAVAGSHVQRAAIALLEQTLRTLKLRTQK